MGAVRRQALLPVAGGEHAIAHLLEQPLGHGAEMGIVLHEEDRVRAAGQQFLFPRGARRQGLLVAEGEIDLHRRPLPYLAVEVHESVVLFHEPVHHGHAESGAHAGGLGGEERLEHARLGLAVHTGAGVAHAEAYVHARLDPGVQRAVLRVEPGAAHVEVQRAAVGHRVARVGRQIQENLLERSGIGLHHARGGLGVAADLDRGGEQAPQRMQLLPNPLGHAERAQVERLVAAEPQQPVHQLGTAPGRVGQLLQIAPHVGGRVGQRFRHQVALRQDHGQQVVEVVGDSGREPADRFHLLGLLQRALQRPLLGDVLGHHLEAFEVAAPLAPHRPARKPHGDVVTVAALPLDLHAADALEGARQLDVASPLRGIDVHIAAQVEGEHLRFVVVAEHGDQRGIDLEEAPLEAGAIDAVGRLLHDGAVVGAGAAQRALRVPARRVFHYDGADAVGRERKVGGAPEARDPGLGRRLARDLDVQRGLARLEDAPQQRLERGRDGGQHLAHRLAQVLRHRAAVHQRQGLVELPVAQLAIEDGEARGGGGEEAIELVVT